MSTVKLIWVGFARKYRYFDVIRKGSAALYRCWPLCVVISPHKGIFMSNENAPKPGPFQPKKKVAPAKKPQVGHEPKKPYAPKPHLTQRPFSNDDLLSKLIKDMGKEDK